MKSIESNVERMSATVERLRVSKLMYLEDLSIKGFQSGQQWAQDLAEFSELTAISRIDIDECEHSPEIIEGVLKGAIDPNDNSRSDDVAEILFGTSHWPPAEWLLGWVRGAQETFDEVEDQF